MKISFTKPIFKGEYENLQIEDYNLFIYDFNFSNEELQKVVPCISELSLKDKGYPILSANNFKMLCEQNVFNRELETEWLARTSNKSILSNVRYNNDNTDYHYINLKNNVLEILTTSNYMYRYGKIMLVHDGLSQDDFDYINLNTRDKIIEVLGCPELNIEETSILMNGYKYENKLLVYFSGNIDYNLYSNYVNKYYTNILSKHTDNPLVWIAVSVSSVSDTHILRITNTDITIDYGYYSCLLNSFDNTKIFYYGTNSINNCINKLQTFEDTTNKMKEEINKNFSTSQLGELESKLVTANNDLYSLNDSMIAYMSRLAKDKEAYKNLQQHIFKLIKAIEDEKNKEFESFYDYLINDELVTYVTYINGVLNIYTKPLIALDQTTKIYHAIGAYKISINRANQSFNFMNLFGKPLGDRQGLHVFSDGRPCLGNGVELFAKLLADKQWKELFQMLITFLIVPNQNDSYGSMIKHYPIYPGQTLTKQQEELWLSRFSMPSYPATLATSNEDMARKYNCEVLNTTYPYSKSEYSIVEKRIRGK